MSQPGWYPDPQDPTRARWWDGHAWGAVQGGPAQTPPARDRRPWVIGAIILVAIAVAVFVIVPSLRGTSGPIAADTNSARPTGRQWDELSPTAPPTDPSPGWTPSAGGEMACPDSSDGSTNEPVGDRMAGGGLSFALSGDWEVNRGYSDMGWAEDVGMYVHSAPAWWSFAGVGRIPDVEGWGSPAGAARNSLDCLASTTFYQSVEEITLVSDGGTSIDGVDGWRTEAKIRSGSGLVDRVIVIVVPVGDRLSVFASAVKDTETELLADVDTAIETLAVDD